MTQGCTSTNRTDSCKGKCKYESVYNDSKLIVGECPDCKDKVYVNKKTLKYIEEAT